MDGTRSPTTAAGLIFDVQRFSLHDGPGIRTTVFFKGCPLRCRWCQNPESLRPCPEVAFYSERCQACFRCEPECPQGAILREGDRRIDFDRCDGCGRCTCACPHDALQRIGEWWSAAALLVEILKDRDYFEDSGGGVTLSGGEPLAQAAFLKKLLPRLKAAGLHVTLQTGGLFPWERMVPLVPFIDLIYFDLKHMEPEAHKRCTGSDNRCILKNFARLAGMAVPLQPRMPVIPDHNDNRENIKATARWLKQNDLDTIRCLPYHNLGEAKQRHIQTQLKPLAITASIEATMTRIHTAFEEEGIHAVIDD